MVLDSVIILLMDPEFIRPLGATMLRQMDSRVAKRTGWNQLPRFESRLHQLWTVGPWASCLISLCLSFLIYKVGHHHSTYCISLLWRAHELIYAKCPQQHPEQTLFSVLAFTELRVENLQVLTISGGFRIRLCLNPSAVTLCAFGQITSPFQAIWFLICIQGRKNKSIFPRGRLGR